MKDSVKYNFRMMDAKEQKLIDARMDAYRDFNKAERKWIEARRKRYEASHKWIEASRKRDEACRNCVAADLKTSETRHKWEETNRKVRKYQESKAQRAERRREDRQGRTE